MDPGFTHFHLHRLLPERAEHGLRAAKSWADRVARSAAPVSAVHLLTGHSDPTLLLVLIEGRRDGRALPAGAESGLGDQLSPSRIDQLDLSDCDATAPHHVTTELVQATPGDSETASVVAVAYLRVPFNEHEEFLLVERSYMAGPVGELPGFAGSTLHHDVDEPGWLVSSSFWLDREAWLAALADHAAMLDAMVVFASDVRVFEFEKIWAFRRTQRDSH